MNCYNTSLSVGIVFIFFKVYLPNKNMHNLLDPAILFFLFGIFAGLIRSNLSIPEPLTKFLSLYLLIGPGFLPVTTNKKSRIKIIFFKKFYYY
jgi:hypothetical protein